MKTASEWKTFGLLFITFLLQIKDVVGKQRCYVCIPNTGMVISDILELFPSGPTIPLCNGFLPGKKLFMRDCPDDDEYKGCITETNGTHVAKTCTTDDVDDCKEANSINYCYCTGDLCNIEPVPVEDPRPAVTTSKESSESSRPSSSGDDEDLSEGSGSFGKSSTEITKSRLPVTNDDIGIEDSDRRNSPDIYHNKNTPSEANRYVINIYLLCALFMVISLRK